MKETRRKGRQLSDSNGSPAMELKKNTASESTVRPSCCHQLEARNDYLIWVLLPFVFLLLILLLFGIGLKAPRHITRGYNNTANNNNHNGATVEKRVSSSAEKVVVTMTTCRRPDLFLRTVYSFLLMCKDWDWYVSDWYVLDDCEPRSIEEWKKQRVPSFITFVNKTQMGYPRGHPGSMNAVLELTKDADYVIHLEDDWQFVEPKNYIFDSLKILYEEPSVCQVLFNENITEFITDTPILAGHRKQSKIYSGFEYALHVNNNESTFSQTVGAYAKSLSNFRQNYWWPHFSLRPGVWRRSCFNESFGEVQFEYRYALKYFALGHRTAYLLGVNTFAIGKPTDMVTFTQAQKYYTAKGVEIPIEKKNTYEQVG